MKSDRRANTHYSSLDITRTNNLLADLSQLTPEGKMCGETLQEVAKHLGRTGIEHIFPERVEIDPSKVRVHGGLVNFTRAEAKAARNRQIPSA